MKTPTDIKILDFWNRVDRKGDDECWIWRLSPGKNGYGQYRWDGRKVSAHRLAFELANGLTATPGLHVRHTCHNRICCNPAHLIQGTPLENEADKVKAGRQAKGQRNGKWTHLEKVQRGEEHGRAKLTAEDVMEIRRLYATGQYSANSLSRQYGVGPSEIKRIVDGTVWTHLIQGKVLGKKRGGQFRLTLEKADRILDESRKGEKSRKELASEFGVSQSTIVDVQKGTWHQRWSASRHRLTGKSIV